MNLRKTGVTNDGLLFPLERFFRRERNAEETWNNHQVLSLLAFKERAWIDSLVIGNSKK